MFASQNKAGQACLFSVAARGVGQLGTQRQVTGLHDEAGYRCGVACSSRLRRVCLGRVYQWGQEGAHQQAGEVIGAGGRSDILIQGYCGGKEEGA